MKTVQTSIIVALAFFLSTSISFGANLDDIDFTIRVVESDDVSETYNEISLPGMIFNTQYEHAGGEAEHRNIASHGGHENEMDVRDEVEDEIENRDEAREDNGDVSDGHRDKHHEKEHRERAGKH